MVRQEKKKNREYAEYIPPAHPSTFSKVDELFHFVALMEWDYLTWSCSNN